MEKNIIDGILAHAFVRLVKYIINQKFIVLLCFNRSLAIKFSICENSKCFKIIVVDSVVLCNRNVNIMDSASTNVTNTLSLNVVNTIPTNVTNIVPTNVANTISSNITSVVSINSNGNKVRYKMFRLRLKT